MRKRLSLAFLIVLSLAGCSKPGADPSAPADPRNGDPAARAAAASDRARASEAEAARLQAEVSQLAAQSGASAELGNDDPPAATRPMEHPRAAPRTPVVTASRTPPSRLLPVPTRAVTKKASKPAAPKPAPEPSISAGELQRQLAPGGLLRPQPDQPKLDYQADPEVKQ